MEGIAPPFNVAVIDVVADPIAKVPVSALADITVPPVPTLRAAAVIIPVIFTLPLPVILLLSKLISPSNVVAVTTPTL